MIHYMSTNGIGQAWVGTEIKAVQRAGIPFMLHAMRKPHQFFFESEWSAEINSKTKVIYPVSAFGFAASLLLAPVIFGPRFVKALFNALFGEKESLRVRVSVLFHFLTACHWARVNRHENISLIHSQWIHSGGTIAMYGAWLLGVPFSFTGHAADIFRDRSALRDKIRRAKAIVCISTFHKEFFLKHGAKEEQLILAYCGINTAHFSPRERPALANRALTIVSTGRLVDKKGFGYLIDACKILIERGRDIRCIIGGSGPLEHELREQIKSLGLEDRITLTGEELTQKELPEFMYKGDLYCLPCVWAPDNDVDGLPQMLMEAMACGCPVVSTRLVGIPDLVIDGETGILVEPNDADALADALDTLIQDETLSAKLAAAGRAHVEKVFDLKNCLEPLFDHFRSHLRTVRAECGARAELGETQGGPQS